MSNLGKYSIIYADPPWTYRDKCNDGKRGACHKYSVMKLSDISLLPVKEISADNSVLFLWATMPQLQNSLSVMDSWGFWYKTVAFIWVKRNKVSPTWFWGMGHWTRANSELVLMGTRGKPRPISHSVHSVIDTPVGKHSKKPDAVRDRIVELMGDVPRIELFARQVTPGWDAIGADIDGLDIQESIKGIIDGKAK